MLKPVMLVNGLFLLISSYAVADNKSAPMQRLSWLLGEWTFVDEQVNGEYWEKGSRNCITVLHEQYIRCESFGTSNKGKQRSYHFIVGYNEMDARYEMIGLTSSYPRQNLYILVQSEDGFTLELENHFCEAEGIVPSNKATIWYNGKDQYIWHIRNGELDKDTGKKAVGFIDTVTRAGCADQSDLAQQCLKQ